MKDTISKERGATWSSCLKSNIARQAPPDKRLSDDLRELSDRRFAAYTALPEEHTETLVTLLYDVVRFVLEAITIERGFRVYNHECYGAFLKELGEEEAAKTFDQCRIIRNDINYYGKKISKEDTEYAVRMLFDLKSKLKTI